MRAVELLEADLTPTVIEQIRSAREESRCDIGGGMCHEVSDFIEGQFGWKRVSGTYCSPRGEVICSAHFWNLLPDGSILDATADQFGEGEDIRVVEPFDPEYRRYREEWYQDWHPDLPEHPGHSDWTGELDYDAENRLKATRGPRWWLDRRYR